MTSLYETNRARNRELMGTEHVHVWAPIVEHAYLTGEPHRKCMVDGCRFVTLDLCAACDGEYACNDCAGDE